MRFWIALAAVGVIAEAVAINRSRDGKDAGTLTHTLRTVFRVDTKIGRAAFLLALGGSAAWTAAHVLEQHERAPAA